MSIWRELEDRGSLNLEDMIRGQSCFYNSQAATLGNALTAALKNTELSDTENSAFTIFETWLQEPVETVDQPGASIYNILYMLLSVESGWFNYINTDQQETR